MTNAQDIITKLNLQPHPEGGYFRETFRDTQTNGNGRENSTAIHFLLTEGQVSHWHRIDATEIWLWHSGSPLELLTYKEGGKVERNILGDNVLQEQHTQLVIPAFHWQSAKSSGAWTLVSCIVAPAFSFEGFELAPKEWQPELV